MNLLVQNLNCCSIRFWKLNVLLKNLNGEENMEKKYFLLIIFHMMDLIKIKSILIKELFNKNINILKIIDLYKCDECNNSKTYSMIVNGDKGDKSYWSFYCS